jgi:type II secretory pathway component GspD/PulD (secretin)
MLDTALAACDNKQTFGGVERDRSALLELGTWVRGRQIMSVARWILRSGSLWSFVILIMHGLSASAQSYTPAAESAAAPAAMAAPQVIDVKALEGGAMTPEMMAAMRAAREKAGEGPGKPATPGQPSGKPDEAKGKETTPTIHRPAAAAAPANREEFKIRPNAAGQVRLNFNGQPWQPVLEWLASISAMSLDWQDLPGDTLNLTTQRSYTVPEVRDLINQHLLARGFTILCHGESMSVVEIKKIDPSLVPRIEPADLAKREPHEFVKVSFPLESFAADTAMNELKPMLSPNGKLTAMNETSRLEAMDAVINLRDIDSVLKQQQARANRPKSFREFKLKYARAEEVHNLLNTLLGIDSGKNPMMAAQGQQGGMDREQMMMMARQQMQAQGGQPQPGGMPGMKESNVSLAVNVHNNSILVQAPPDKMAIIAQAIEAVDIPVDRNALSMVNMGRMQVYRLSGVDPEPIVKTLMDIGNLDPTTRLEVDKKNSAIIAYAPLADHVTIRALVDKLTGSDRKFEVIRLRRLAADYVAGTIEFMLGSGQKKDQQRRSPWSWYDSPREEEKKTREFRVDADVEHNRLLLWANPVELAEVEALLVKLGEIPAAGSGAANVRVIEGGDAKENAEFIERLRRIWPSVAPNELQTPAPSPPPATEENRERATRPPEKEKDAHTTQQAPLPDGIARHLRAQLLRYADTRGEAAIPAADQRLPADVRDIPRPAPPPVKITIGPDGKLLISSQDQQALDLLESLAAEMPVSRKDYRIFHLRYSQAISVVPNLEDYFKEKNDRNRDMPWWYYDYPDQNNTQDDRRLSKRPKLKFICDDNTNTILVEGASQQQLKTIEELIQIYDQPPPSDSQSVRKTELIHMKYSKAKSVADTVKDVYRDLLSSNDKALAEQNQGNGRRYIYNFGSDIDSSGQKMPHFKGLLSIGVDENSNSLLVSAPAFLFDHVSKMIIELDKAAAPEYEVRVVHVAGLSADRVRELFDEVYNNKQPEKQPEKPTAEKKPAGKSSQKSKSGGKGNSDKQHQDSSEKKEAG